MKFRKICIDMDGVMCDYMTQSAELFDMGDAYRSYLKCPFPGDCEQIYNISSDEYKHTIDAAGTGFWEEMPKLDWADELFRTATENAYGVTFLTNPGRFEHSHVGKILWLKKHNFLGRDVDVTFSKNKYLHAGPTDLLVDDYTVNTDHWENRGGIALLVKRPWTFGRGLDESDVIAEIKNPRNMILRNTDLGK